MSTELKWINGENLIDINNIFNQILILCKSQYINVQKTENVNVQISATLPTEFPEKFAFPGVCMTDL